MIESMGEGSKNASKASKEVYESQLGNFEVDVVPELRSQDIGNDDRALIMTESGNRYMIRHSKGRGESLVIYNERDEGFNAKNAHPFLIRNEAGNRGPIARVGRSLNVFVIMDEKANTGSEWNSTLVSRIEIRRGIEAAIRKEVSRQNSGEGGNLFEGIVNAMSGLVGDARSTAGEQETDPFDPKYRR
jgi:hypothetical protein